MIAPIYVDLIFSFCAVIMGLAAFFTSMRVVADDVYTPMLEAMVVCLGSLSWAIFGFLALSAITTYPPLHTSGYQGHWGYTSARALGCIGWGLTLLMITRYSAYMQVRKTPTKKCEG